MISAHDYFDYTCVYRFSSLCHFGRTDFLLNVTCILKPTSLQWCFLMWILTWVLDIFVCLWVKVAGDSELLPNLLLGSLGWDQSSINLGLILPGLGHDPSWCSKGCSLNNELCLVGTSSVCSPWEIWVLFPPILLDLLGLLSGSFLTHMGWSQFSWRSRPSADAPFFPLWHAVCPVNPWTPWAHFSLLSPGLPVCPPRAATSAPSLGCTGVTSLAFCLLAISAHCYLVSSVLKSIIYYDG